MEKGQILTAVIVGVLVIGVAVYRVMRVGSSSAAAVGLRRFPKTPGKLLRWMFGAREEGRDGHPGSANHEKRV